MGFASLPERGDTIRRSKGEVTVKTRYRYLASRALAVVAVVASTAFVAPVLAQTPIQSQDSNVAGVVAEITECKRADGVLTIRMRLRNTGSAATSITLVENRKFDGYYLTAGSKKYFILKDSDGTPLAPQLDTFGKVAPSIDKGGQYTWWSKYPAPPADVKKVSYFTPVTGPFDNIPITD
jgi:hypothetical protein